jgi:hypothetical protein
MAYDLARQRSIKGLAAPLLADMPGNLNTGFDGNFLGHRAIRRS